MKTIRAVIIHARPEIRATLREMLAGERDIQLVGEFTDGPSGSQAIKEHRPELLFMGVRLRGMNGFELVRSTNYRVPPAVIFASPYEQYAVRAFDVHAVDYLLKPFTRERFQQALTRARDRIKRREARPAPRPALPVARPAIIGVKSGRNIVLLRPPEINSVVASRGHCLVTTKDQSCRTRTSLADFQKKLPPGLFIRINRTTLVNSQRVHRIARKAHGDARLRLDNGQEFALGRRYRAQWSVFLPARSRTSRGTSV